MDDIISTFYSLTLVENNSTNKDKDNEDEVLKLVNSMRNPINYKTICIKMDDTLTKCIYCKKYLSPTQWGPLLEKHIKKLFNLSNPINNISGDGLSLSNKKIEIKVSLGGSSGNFNIVQIRPDHDIDYYIILLYDLYSDSKGKEYWLLIPSYKLYELIIEYGSYAHGTINKLGPINNNTIYGNNNEYALRFNPNIKDENKPKKIWNLLIELYKMSINEIKNII